MEGTSGALLSLLVSDDVEAALAYVLGYLLLWGALSAAFAQLRGVPELRGKAVLTSYLLTGLVPVAQLSWHGVASGHVLFSSRTSEFRLLEAVPEALTVCHVQLAYQVFAIVGAVVVGPPLNQPEMILHHVCAGLCGLSSFLPFMQFYSIFFGGLVEISNLPLTCIDICKCHPRLRETYAKSYELIRVLFAISFIFFRNILWPYFAFLLCSDAYHLRERLPTVGEFFVYVVSVSLTVLQLVWGRLVVRNVARALAPKDRTS